MDREKEFKKKAKVIEEELIPHYYDTKDIVNKKKRFQKNIKRRKSRKEEPKTKKILE